MTEIQALPARIAEKLAAFDTLEPEFEASFRYVQDVQGQRRFAEIPIVATVRYLHALWICERKDRLLSVPQTVDRYEGRRCLELLRQWHIGESADVVTFLQRKLDALPFGEITRQLEAARRQTNASHLAQRLEHGRLVLLNRGFNLHTALEPLFTLPEDQMREQVRSACQEYGHTPLQIEEQRQMLQSPLYAFVRHPALAQRNMVVMDRLGIQVTGGDADQPGNRSWTVARPTMPSGPYAEQVIRGYVPLTAPQHNNPAGVRFTDRPEPVDLLRQRQEEVTPEAGAAG